MVLLGVVVGEATIVLLVVVVDTDFVVVSGSNRIVEVLSISVSISEVKTKVDVDVVVGSKKNVDVSTSGTVSVKAMVDVTVTPGRVLTPPGPVQRRPMGQHPYWPLVPSQQVEVTGHPPCASGQHV